MTASGEASDVTATATTAAQNEAVRLSLPFGDEQDFEDARRGFVAALSPSIVESTSGRVVWDMESFEFLEGACPDTVNPSLWRQAQLNAIHGLFEVVPGVYQVRGLDLSNMTIVEGDSGVVVIDPLISTETAAAALALYREHRGDRPVTGLIYTHSHVDHFGGAKGVLTPEDVDHGVPILAPEGLVREAVSENVYAGPAMGRRARYMYGSLLDRGPVGQVSAGLGMTTSAGTVSLLRPTVDLSTTGEDHVVDGVRMIFQLTPGTEAPAEMNFHFPDLRLLCVAENATHNLHNLLTLRGALVRDPHRWSSYLNETIELFGAGTDVIFASHHWPCWGNDRVLDFLRKQRDLYGYLHDQTLRLLNQGFVGSEIAEMLDLPPSLADEWHCRGYYGSVNHNVKAIYQRYMGWFDGNPAHLWGHPPVEAARRYVDYMGGPEAVVGKARRSFAEGDYRWVVEVLNHVIFADPDNTEARKLEAEAFKQLGFGAENATWRNFFLTGAQELRKGPEKVGKGFGASPDMVAALSGDQFLDLMAIRVDGPRAAEHHMVFNVELVDRDERFAVTLSNGVLTYIADKWHDDAPVSLYLEALQLAALTVGLADFDQAVADSTVRVEGDDQKVRTLLGLLDQPTPGFPLVTP